MRRKIWRRLFLQITLIFVVFAVIFTVTTGNFLYSFFMSREKAGLKSSAQQILSQIDGYTKLEVDIVKQVELKNLLQEELQPLWQQSIEVPRNYMIEVYSFFGDSPEGLAWYITSGHSLMEGTYFERNRTKSYKRRPVEVLDQQILSDQSVYENVRVLENGLEYLTYQAQVDDVTVKLTVQKGVVEKYAGMSNQVMWMILLGCLGISLIWVFLYARRFSKPISEMNEITQKMASLDFRQRLKPKTQDEIGQLGLSINKLADKLDSTLYDLSLKNAKLAQEIEMERSLETMRKEFVANVSHELKTPIAIIQGYAEGLQMNVNDSAVKREEYADVIIQESKKMNLLVQDLLELSQYETKQFDIKPSVFEIEPLIQSACKLLNSPAQKKNVELQVEIPENNFVYADERRIEQVLKNYLSNALSHVNEGGSIRISSEKLEKAVRISVFNTGSIIEEQELEKIWQSFYRADQSRKRSEGRYGLGLSIVSAIQKLHGMGFGVYNLEDGVCFWFDLALPEKEQGNGKKEDEPNKSDD